MSRDPLFASTEALSLANGGDDRSCWLGANEVAQEAFVPPPDGPLTGPPGGIQKSYVYVRVCEEVSVTERVTEVEWPYPASLVLSHRKLSWSVLVPDISVAGKPLVFQLYEDTVAPWTCAIKSTQPSSVASCSTPGCNTTPD